MLPDDRDLSSDLPCNGYDQHRNFAEGAGPDRIPARYERAYRRYDRDLAPRPASLAVEKRFLAHPIPQRPVLDQTTSLFQTYDSLLKQTIGENALSLYDC